VYRALVRRCHPDLAQTEADRVRLGALMARINGLYAERDLRRLERRGGPEQPREPHPQLDQRCPDRPRRALLGPGLARLVLLPLRLLRRRHFAAA